MSPKRRIGVMMMLVMLDGGKIRVLDMIYSNKVSYCGKGYLYALPNNPLIFDAQGLDSIL